MSEYVEKQLSEVEFRRWRKIMAQMDPLVMERTKLEIRLGEINRKVGKLSIQMQQLWQNPARIKERSKG